MYPNATINQVSQPSPGSLRQAGILLAGVVVFGLFAYLSIDLSRGSGRIAVIWIPNALAVAYLLRSKETGSRPFVAACLCGNVAANLAVGDTMFVATCLAVANAVEIALAILLVRKWCGMRPDMSDIGHLTRFMLGACVIAPLASASIAIFAIGGLGSAILPTVLRWAMSDALSMLIVAPSALVFWDSFCNRRWPTRKEALQWIVLTTVGTSLTFIVFSQTLYPLLFLVPPIVVAHAFWLGSLGTAFSVLKVAAIALVFTNLGSGPINLLPVEADIQLLLLEAFLASATIVGLPVAAILSTRDRMTRELSTGQKQLALLADNITDAVLRYDLDGVCTYASPSTERVLGAPPGDFIGSTTQDRSHPESSKAIMQVRDRLLSGESEIERFTYRRLLDDDDGEAVYIEADCAVARDAVTGEREGIVVSARDVTQRVVLERRLKRAMRHAENAARAKAQFLANMSHEIRTPMNGVLGFADLLRQMPLDPDAARYAELIVRSGRSMMMLLNDILDISKIESGQLVLSLETIDLHQLAEDCVQLHQAGASSKGIDLSLTLDSGLPRETVSDPLRLRQILLNLIANAVKFTSQGSVEVRVAREGDSIRFQVEDSGIGIDAARIDQIFDPFVQEEVSTTRRFGGTGLGLSISRQLAHLLGGSLQVESMLGIGSRFSLFLPFEESITQDPAQPAKAVEASLSRPRFRARILLAEDHDINRMLMVAMLERLGQTVVTAADGLEAVAKALEKAGSEEAFDLVLMDIQMPGCDGYSATRMIRNGGLDALALPIVALTANAYTEDVEAALESGMQAHLAKPVVFEELAETLVRWLPVRIVEEPPAAGAEMTSAPAHSPAMLEQWRARRQEAIAAVSHAIDGDGFEGAGSEQLARTVHKLAGTAGLFGEAELGRKAAALERALKTEAEGAERRRLAEELLAVA